MLLRLRWDPVEMEEAGRGEVYDAFFALPVETLTAILGIAADVWYHTQRKAEPSDERLPIALQAAEVFAIPRVMTWGSGARWDLAA